MAKKPDKPDKVVNKELKVKKVDVDVDKDIDADLDVDIELEKDVDISTSHTHIFAVGVDKDAEVKVVKKDIDVDIDIEKEIKHKTEVEVDIDKNISEWNVKVDVHASNIIQGSDISEWHDNDVNDIDNQDLINVKGNLNMDDFTSDQLAIGNSFNGSGNDSQYHVNQSNDLDDNDTVGGTTATYNNAQKPNIDFDLDIKLGSKGKPPPHKPPPKPKYDGKKDDGKKDGGKDDWGGGHSPGVFASVHADLEIEAPDDAFQTVEADGGTANSGDGIANAGGSNLSSHNQGSGQITGDSSATADGVATAEAFTASVLAGGNQQANFATMHVAGGDQGAAGNGHGYKSFGNDDGGHGHDDPPPPPKDGDGLAIKDSWITKDFDNDVNDLDSQDLINVSDYSTLNMDDFDLDITAIGNSFNGPGNDMQFSVDQSNDLVDQDNVTGTTVTYNGGGWQGPFQDVSATGGDGTSGNGIGHVNPNTGASGNGGDGIIAGSTAASGSALASAEAFTANVVVGANVQVNNFSATVVGGDSAAIIDDIDA